MFFTNLNDLNEFKNLNNILYSSYAFRQPS
jgi:hypothetical protein